ncbi:MAG: hypothetical protein WD396_00595 [Pseudohongiellaceae bacterium]
MPPTSGIPADSVNSDLTFNFDLTAATGKTINTGSAYTFQAGMFIQDDANQRRLEFSISNITITFDSAGNIVSGSVAAGNNASVSGRSADGGTTANIVISNGLLSFTDTTLAINAGAQINDIQAGDPILADLTNTINSPAAYKYGVFLKQTGGPEGITLGLTDGTVFGCAPGNPMVLANQTNFQGAYALQGAMGVGMAAGANPAPYATGTANCATNPALAAPSPSPSPTPAPSASPAPAPSASPAPGASPSPSPAPEPLVVPTDETNATIDEAEDTVDDAINDLANLDPDSLDAKARRDAIELAVFFAQNAVFDLVSLATNTSRPLDGDSAVDIIAAAARALQLAGKASSVSGVKTIGSSATLLVSSIEAVLNKLRTQGLQLTETQKTAINGTIKDGVNAAAQFFQNFKLLEFNADASELLAPGASSDGTAADYLAVLSDQTPLQFTTNMIDEVSGTLNEMVALAVPIDAELSGQLSALVADALAFSLGSIAESVDSSLDVEFTDAASTRQLLVSDPRLITPVLDVAAIELPSSTPIDAASISSLLQAEGLTAADADALGADIATYVDPTGVAFSAAGGDITAASALVAAIGAGATVDFAGDRFVTDIELDGMSYPVNILKSYLVPDAFPEGAFNLPDGSVVATANGVANLASPGLANILAFTSAINSVSATVATTANGGILLTGSDFLFSGTPGFAGQPSAATSTGPVTFTVPTGNPASPNYVFTALYSETSQTIAPYVSNPAFYEVLAEAGFQITMDRNNGLIFIDGSNAESVNGLLPAGDTRVYRADYFIEGLGFITPDHIFQIQVEQFEAAFRPVDANGDGVTDYRVIFADSVQILYGVP